MSRKRKLFFLFKTSRSQLLQKLSITNFYGEFDLGSGRTLAACLIHASRAQEINRTLRGDVYGMSGGRVSNTWATCL